MVLQMEFKYVLMLIASIIAGLVSMCAYGGNPFDTYALTFMMLAVLDFTYEYRVKNWGDVK